MRSYKRSRGPSNKKRREQTATDAGSGDPLLKGEPRPARRLLDLHVQEFISRILREEFGILHTELALFVWDQTRGAHAFLPPTIPSDKAARYAQQACKDFERLVRLRGSREGTGRGSIEVQPATDDASTAALDRRLRPSASPTSQLKVGTNMALAQNTSLVKSEFDGRPVKRQRPVLQNRFEAEQEVSDCDVRDITDVTPGLSNELRIGDSKAVTALYWNHLLLLQQKLCKHIAKAWIKVIHPKKQTRYPYRGAEKTAPPWWPKSVLHKEPDHLKKRPRMNLLLEILRMKRVDIDLLEKATDELQVEDIVKKRYLLAEIYRVARQERRVWDEVLDPHTVIFVTPTPRDLIVGDGKKRSLGSSRLRFRQEGNDNDVVKQESEDESIDSATDETDESDGEMPEGSLQDESFPLCEIDGSNVQPCQVTSTSNIFQASFPLDTSPMDSTPFAAYQSASVFQNHQIIDGTALRAGASDGAEYLQHSHSFQGDPMSQMLGPEWQSASSPFSNNQSLYSPFVSNPPMLPSQPPASLEYSPLLQPGNETALSRFAQGQQAPEQVGFSAVAHAMPPQQFRHPLLMGTMRTGSIGDPHRVQEDPAGLNFGHYPGQAADKSGTSGHDRDGFHMRIKEERPD